MLVLDRERIRLSVGMNLKQFAVRLSIEVLRGRLHDRSIRLKTAQLADPIFCCDYTRSAFGADNVWLT
jgi:hypothetical protein